MADRKDQTFGKADRPEEIDEDQLQQAVGGTRTTPSTSFGSLMKKGAEKVDNADGNAG